MGPKQEVESYKNILKKIGFEPSEVLFLTDVVKGMCITNLKYLIILIAIIIISIEN